jgi:ribosomal protein S18 acetylase RimI-like enzyme
MSNEDTTDPASLEFVLAESLDQETAGRIAARIARMDPWLTLDYSQGLLSAYLRDDKPDRLLYLIQAGGKSLGALTIRYPWLRGAYVELLAVFPECQGGGVGSAAIRFVEARFRGLAANLWLLVSSFNERAQRFYRRNGFHPIGTIEDFMVPGRDEILMRKRI